VVPFDDFKRPACLHVTRYINERDAVATGWGETELAKRSERLLKVTLPLVSFDRCKQYFQRDESSLRKGLDERTMVCAGGNGGDTLGVSAGYRGEE